MLLDVSASPKKKKNLIYPFYSLFCQLTVESKIKQNQPIVYCDELGFLEVSFSPLDPGILNSKYDMFSPLQ